MATFTQDQHGFRDDELINCAQLARLLGVSRPAVSQVTHERSGRLDLYLNSRGEVRLHPVHSVQQWSERRRASKVTTPTTAQAAAGLDNLGAMAVSHLPLVRPPAGAGPAQDGHRGPGRPKGSTAGRGTLEEAEEGKTELALSRAEREKFSARLLELKVRKEEGTLADRAVFYQQAYTLANSIKDQLNGLPPQLAPAIVSAVDEALASSGLQPVQIRAAFEKSRLEHAVREALRTGIVRALRALTDKPVEELLR